MREREREEEGERESERARERKSESESESERKSESESESESERATEREREREREREIERERERERERGGERGREREGERERRENLCNARQQPNTGGGHVGDTYVEHAATAVQSDADRRRRGGRNCDAHVPGVLAPHRHAVDLDDFVARQHLTGLVRDAARQELLDEDLAGGVGVKQQPQPDIPLVRHALPSLPRPGSNSIFRCSC